MVPYADKEKQKAYMRDYLKRQREELKQLREQAKKKEARKKEK